MLLVLMPSRGRARQAREAIEAFDQAKTLSDGLLIPVVDETEADDYQGSDVIRVGPHASGQGMGPALNAAVEHVLGFYPEATVIGFQGDDHRMRTPGFDERIVVANAQMDGGLVYGNDLIRGEELPSAVFMDARVARALGWMALPGARHLYLDDTWRELGKRMRRLRYLPDVIVEHLHPLVGKADWDEGYARVNDPAMYDHDRHVYSQWLADGLDRDAATALAALG